MIFQEDDKQEIISRFLDLCSIDNESGNEDQIVEWVKHHAESLGLELYVDDAKNIHFFVEGEGEPIFLNAHMDSVQPCCGKEPAFDGSIFYSQGDTVLGADTLAGVLSVMMAVTFLNRHAISHAPLDILFTTMEEIGGAGIKSFDFTRFQSHKGIVVDSKGPVGSFVMKSPTKANFSLFISAQTMHASYIQNNISAVVIMAELIHALPVGKIQEGLFLNIGMAEGGQAVNSVPGAARIEGEIRGNSQEVQGIIDLIQTIVKKIEKKYDTQILFSHNVLRESYEISSDEEIVDEIISTIKNIDLEPQAIESHGVSDANTFRSKGYNALLIGTGVKDLHTTKETISLESLLKLIELIIEFCRV